MTIRDSVRHGILGGVAGGMVFGIMMWIMGMLPMIGSMIGLPSALAGFVVHMMMSTCIGAAFGLFIRLFPSGKGVVLAAGVTYGALWWVLGPLAVMPWMMGEGFAANLNAAKLADSIPSLVGHVGFGGVLGTVYVILVGRARRRVHRRNSGDTSSWEASRQSESPENGQIL